MDLRKITIEKLSQPATLTELKALIGQYLEQDNVDDSRDLVMVLQGLFEINKDFALDYPELFREYQRLLSLLKFISLQTLPEKEVQDLFRGRLLIALRNNINLNSKLDGFFLLWRDQYSDDQSRKTLVKAMMDNTELVGRSALKFAGKAEVEAPTIGNWLKDFMGSFTFDRPLSNLEELEYANKSLNYRHLSADEKNTLQKIIRLYNFLRFPVHERELVRETGHRVASTPPVLRPEAPAPIKIPTDPLLLLKEKYRHYRQGRRAVLEAEDSLVGRTKADPEELKRELSAAARRGDKTVALACLKVLARSGELPQALRSSPAWYEAIRERITAQYGRQYQPDELTLALSNLKLEAGSPIAVSEFLQYVLKDKLRLNENDSALVGVELSQILGGPYQSLAYGNAETGSFEWTKHKIMNGRMVSEG